MISISANSVQQYSAYDQSLFGGNFLFNRDVLGEDSPYSDLASDLGISSFRYPGGSMTERLFDISNPDRSSGYDYESGETTDLVPLSDFMGFVGSVGGSATIVLPTRQFLSETTDPNGNRFPEIDHDELSKFVQDLACGAYGSAKIDAFEIGNEYWGSGQMSAVEYGRLASEMSATIDSALAKVSPSAQGEIDIVVQSGTNFDHSKLDDKFLGDNSADEILSELTNTYGVQFDSSFLDNSGRISWSAVNNELIINEFDEAELAAVDGVATHIYSRGEANTATRDFPIKLIENSWIEVKPELETYVTEWNLKSSRDVEENSSYGLKHAHEMLNLVEEFSSHGVDTAHVWPLIQTTRNAMSHGWEGEKLSPAGEMFRLMQESLPGNQPLSLEGAGLNQNELRATDLDIHTFGSPGKLVLFFASTCDEFTTSEIDISRVATGGDKTSVSFLGVAEGQEPTDVKSIGVVEVPAPEEILSEIYSNNVIRADLDAYEIMRVEIENPTWSPDMEALWSGDGVEDPIIPDPDEPSLPEVPSDDPPPDPDDDVENAEGGGIEGILGIILFLPFLLGLGGLGA